MMPIFVNTSAKATRGFSLVEMLVGLAIMAIAMGVMAGYLSSISAQQRILMQRSDSIGINNEIINFLHLNQNCTGNINAAAITVPAGAINAGPFNIACANPPLGPGGCKMTFLSYYKPDGTIGQPALYTGLQPDGSGINITSFQLQGVTTTGTPGQYSANLVVNYGGPPPTPPALSVPIMLTASSSGSGDLLQSCSQSSCASGYTVISSSTGAGENFCVESTINSVGARDFLTASSVCAKAGAHLCTPTEWTSACLWDGGLGGGKLHMGITAEWVSLLHLYDNGTGATKFGRWNGTVMGAPAKINVPTAYNGTCIDYQQSYTGPNTLISNNYNFRCCYKP